MPFPRRRVFVTSSFFMTLAACTGSGTVAPTTSPPGVAPAPKPTCSRQERQRFKAMRRLASMDIYLVGFHPMKNDPSHQMEAHHFCHQVNEDFAQCALFDGNTADANLTASNTSSPNACSRPAGQERQYWHPHNGEILSRQLSRRPACPAAAEHELMNSKMNSYGKGPGMSEHRTEAGDKCPRPTNLAWSFSREGEAQPGLVEGRDREMEIATAEQSAGARISPVRPSPGGRRCPEGKLPPADPADTRCRERAAR